MKREHFVEVVEETLESLPQEFRISIRNVAVLVEDLPRNQRSSKPGNKEGCFWASSFMQRTHH